MGNGVVVGGWGNQFPLRKKTNLSQDGKKNGGEKKWNDLNKDKKKNEKGQNQIKKKGRDQGDKKQKKNLHTRGHQTRRESKVEEKK